MSDLRKKLEVEGKTVKCYEDRDPSKNKYSIEYSVQPVCFKNGQGQLGLGA